MKTNVTCHPTDTLLLYNYKFDEFLGFIWDFSNEQILGKENLQTTHFLYANNSFSQVEQQSWSLRICP